jgi:hypothetical protein
MVSQALRKIACVGLSALCIAIGGFQTASANASPNGLTVSPATEQIALTKGQNTAAFNARITNNTGSPVSVTVSARDFTSLAENGRLSFIPDGTATTHGLTRWISVATPRLILGPGQSVIVPIDITRADSLAPGGHYAALIYKVANEPNGRGNTVTISQAVSTLIFLTTYSQGTQRIRLSPVPLANVTTALPSSLDVVLANDGNTQTTPRGYVQVTNSKGNVVAEGITNTDSGMILPGGKRLFTIPLRTMGIRAFTGRYTVKIFYRHDGQTAYQTYSKQFVLIGLPFLLAVPVIMLLLVVVIIKLIAPKLRKPKQPPKQKTTTKRVNIDVTQL